MNEKIKHTDRFVSSKNNLAESGMPSSRWAFVPAPLMPDVALVEFPPINLKSMSSRIDIIKELYVRLLVKK